jgi:dTDP-4-amino-4,6-dideoxygalactose transaminase
MTTSAATPTAASGGGFRPIPFNLTKPQYLELKDEIDGAIRRVLDENIFILHREGEAFEREFASYLGVERVVGVGSGTEAIHLALRALGVGEGDEVLTVSHTAVATTVAISSTGATPVFVDIDPESFEMDTTLLAGKLTARTKAIVPVHLYGHPFEVEPVLAFAKANGLKVVEDAAQAHGAQYQGQTVGTFGDAAAFSFYPTKNLGAYGDGGAIATNDAALADRLVMLRNYGWEAGRRYYSLLRGVNSRLDELQAAILRVKLAHLDEGNDRRRALAELYGELLAGVPGITLPIEQPWAHHVYHLYVIRVAGEGRRDALQQHLRGQQIGSQIHYPEPVHLQAAYSEMGYAPGALPETERACGEILSLPFYPELSHEDARRVAAEIRRFVRV